MKFRAHHLICRLGFRGLGYDKRFARVMKEVLASFKLNPELKLKIVKEADILCAACPNRKGAGCFKDQDSEQEAEIKKLDQFVIDKLGLTEGQIYSLAQLEQRIAKLFTERDLEEFCGSCQWREYGYCRQGLQELKGK
ncbi:DUF1284 domain-containing protein [Natroniella sulfidigena]|uniref:DUF1284 domain-containing protein n=1 Tax=Natroniella sulfidigena TaxID=723921 RepID=UPI00200A0E14|nr:DUF1284 domain-containing protein [Natroniella sulfidigena]MCK8817229.1 DUF1284 domain-containing protein [Natroniella sulfidigena]